MQKCTKMVVHESPTEQPQIIIVRWKHPLLSRAETIYTISPCEEGARSYVQLNIKHTAVSRFFSLPRAGISLDIPCQDFKTEKAEWYGRGPHENMPDRKSGAVLGAYSLPVASDSRQEESLEHCYMRPQENGSRTDPRALSIRDGAINVTDLSGRGFIWTLHPYTAGALDEARHIHELQYRPCLTLTLDGEAAGAGGDLPGFACLHSPYILKPGVEHYLNVRMVLRNGEI
jgi:hypothetical protein